MSSSTNERHRSSSRPSTRRHDSDSDSSIDSGRSKSKSSRPAPPQRHDSDITGSDGSSYADTEKKHESESDDGSHRSRHSRSSRRAETFPIVKKHHYETTQVARRPREYASDTDSHTHRSRRSHRQRSPSTSESEKSDSEDEKARQLHREKRKNAIQAALTAGAVEAWRSRHDPGGIINAKKAMRIAGAAIAAGGLDAIMMQGDNHEHFAKMAEALVGGLALSSTLGGKITHRREGGAKGKAGDSLIAIAAGKLIEGKLPGFGGLAGAKASSSGRSKSAGPSSSRRSRR